MRNRWNKTTLLWGLAMLSVITGFHLLIARGQYQRLRELKALSESTRISVQENQSLQDQIVLLENQLDKLRRENARADEQMPRELKLGAFLKDVALYAEEFDLEHETNTGDTLESNGIVVLPIELSIKGSFSDVFAFVSKLERMERVSRIESFVVETDNERFERVNVDLRLLIFFRSSDGARVA
jgi:Tfp pilus assembly protein PilO